VPRLTTRNPKYRRHRASGQAIVSLNGQDRYLGPHGSQASRAEYDRLIGEWLANGRTLKREGGPPLEVAALVLAYWQHVQQTQRGDDGKPSDHAKKIKRAIAYPRRLYGHTPAALFGPLALRAVRQAMIEPRTVTVEVEEPATGKTKKETRQISGVCRTTANAFTDLVRRMFRWAVEHEMLPASVYHGLTAVEGLRKGKSTAREGEPVRPVADAWVDAIRPPLVSPIVRAMIDLQLVTGMRPGEVCQMRTCDIGRDFAVWHYTPKTHKTQHHGHERIIHLGPAAQEVVRPYLKLDTQAYLFSPAASDAWWREQRQARRKTPLSCGTVAGDRHTRCRERAPGGRFTVATYRRAIARACDAAFPPPPELARQYLPAHGRKRKSTRKETAAEWRARLGPERWAELRKWRDEHRWHPHQLRHNAATRLRKQYGLEAARVILGHKSAAVAEVYAEIDQTKARQIMGEVGFPRGERFVPAASPARVHSPPWTPRASPPPRPTTWPTASAP
jgi:integrase